MLILRSLSLSSSSIFRQVSDIYNKNIAKFLLFKTCYTNFFSTALLDSILNPMPVLAIEAWSGLEIFLLEFNSYF